MLKRLLCFFFIIVLMLCIGFIAFASDSYVVSSTDVTAKQGDSITVPINLSGNKGLMGFRISVNYPNNHLLLKNVSSGSITKNGMLNTTIKDYVANEGSFDILWSNSSGVSGDGTLAIIAFSVKSEAKNGECSIKLSFSQEDTFDGEFNDVKFSCKPITVAIGENNDATQQQETTGSTNNSGSDKVSDDYLVNTVQDALDSLGGKELSELNEQQKKQLLDEVNSKIGSYDANAKNYSDFEKLSKDYGNATKNEAVRKVMETADDSVITDVISSVLEDYGVKRFRDIPPEKQAEAFQKVKEGLEKKGADVSGFDNVQKEDLAEVIDALSEQALKQSETGELTNNPKKKTQISTGVKIAIVILTFAVIALVICFIYKLKNKRRTNNEKSE